MEISPYAKKNFFVNYIFNATFKPGGLTAALLKGGVFFQKACETPPGA